VVKINRMLAVNAPGCKQEDLDKPVKISSILQEVKIILIKS
jgi:hypothetical protein